MKNVTDVTNVTNVINVINVTIVIKNITAWKNMRTIQSMNMMIYGMEKLRLCGIMVRDDHIGGVIQIIQEYIDGFMIHIDIYINNFRL